MSRRPGLPVLVLLLGGLAVEGNSAALGAQSLFPSPLTDTCLFHEGELSPVDESSLEGRVRDGSHDIPVPGARVDARWMDDGGEDVAAEAWTDPDGRFRFCRIPEGVEVRLSPEVGGGPGDPVDAVSGRSGPIALVVPLPSPEEGSGLLGTVIEAESNRAVSGAEILLPELGRAERSHDDGAFVFERIEPGSYVLEIRHVSYGELSDTVHLVAGRPLQVRFDLAPDPIRIAGVEATARSRDWLGNRAAILSRMRQGHGSYITRADIERRNEPPLYSLLNEVAGVRAEYVSHPWGNTYYPVIRSCGTPAVFVDGARIAIAPENGVGINEFLSSHIELVEVYRGASGAPAQYSDGRAACGVILIWTLAPG